MLVSFVGKTCTFLRLFPALNRRLKNASPASCDALRITFSVTLFCAPNERLDPKMDHRLLVIKNPPRFFFAQPPSRTRRSQLSRAHTHFHTPQTFENTNQFPVWPTVSPYLSQYPPDSRQQGFFHRLPDSRFFQRAYSTSLPVFPLFLFRKTNRQVRG